jgi:hypothetical protein
MRATATALKERSLEMFKTALKDYTERKCFPFPRYSGPIYPSSFRDIDLPILVSPPTPC